MEFHLLCKYCLVASVALVLIGIAFALVKHRKEFAGVGAEVSKKHSIFTTFQVFLIWYFFAVAALFLPIYLNKYFTEGMDLLNIVKSVLLSVHNGLRVFILDGDFNDFIEVIGAGLLQKSETLYEIYLAYTAVIYVASPLMTAGFVLSFFKNASSLFRYTFSFSKEICYISELNDVSIALAANILTEKRDVGEYSIDPLDECEKPTAFERLAAAFSKIWAVIKSVIPTVIWAVLVALTMAVWSIEALIALIGYVLRLLFFRLKYAKAPADRKKEISEASGKIKPRIPHLPKVLNRGKRPTIVFFDVYESNEEYRAELIDRAARLGCICFSKDITEIGLKRSGSIKRKFYFVGNAGAENMQQAIAMINHCREARGGRYNNRNTEFYVFSTTTESEALLDAINKGDMKVRRVNEKRNLILHTMVDQDIFKSYRLMPDGTKRINVLIVGAGNYGTELLKSLCWCGQLPGYSIAVHIADMREDVLDSIKEQMPELVSLGIVNGVDSRETDGPYYEIYTHGGIDVKNNSLTKLIEEIEAPTSVFVTLGNDELNVEIAMKLRGAFRRIMPVRVAPAGAELPPELPRIFSVVYSTAKNETFKSGIKIAGKEECDITFIGDMRSRYSLKVIEQRMLEDIGFQVHIAWVDNAVGMSADDKKQAKREQLGFYEGCEYYRRASIATVIHMLLMKKLKIEIEGDDFILPDKRRIEGAARMTEHRRWSAFMRGEGWIYRKKKDFVAKTHPDLIPFRELSAASQEKDAVVLYRRLHAVKAASSDNNKKG